MPDIETSPMSRLLLELDNATEEHASLSQEERCAWLAFVRSREGNRTFALGWRRWAIATERLRASAKRLWELRVELLMDGRAGLPNRQSDV